MALDKNELAEKPVGKLLLDYALPAIVATTASSLYNIIDRIFIGQGVGALAISGLALTFPIMNLMIAFSTLVGAGAGAMVSIRMGQQRKEDAIRTLGNATLLIFCIGTTVSVLALIFLDDLLRLFQASEATLPYARDFMRIILAGNVIGNMFFGLNGVMRSSGHPTKAMVSILLTVGVNIILAPIFIFGFGWGIKGAALATVIAQTIGLVWVLAHFINKKPYIHFERYGFKLSASIIKNIFAIGFSPFIIHVLASLVTVIMNWKLAFFGGDLAIGAFGIINSFVSLIVMIVLGLTQGMQPIIGYNYGAKRMDRVFATLKIAIIAATACSLGGFILGETVPGWIARAFNNDPTLVAITVRGMRLDMAVFFLIGFQMVVSNFFQAIGRAKTAAFLSLSRQAIFLIPLLLIVPNFWGLDGVWLAAAISDAAAFATSALVLWIFVGKVKKEYDERI
ncbi:MATE family efflux transporter [Bacteroidales bacterium OttesenSCG-928-B11]|nr:MATE family efflux transporter [Bacteroidales bacterium OttesenSCG-928-B11]MDL2325910.1 MATE family efflux transporter [Bacteroidales bacterium OttesenSCG-928-A14]